MEPSWCSNDTQTEVFCIHFQALSTLELKTLKIIFQMIKVVLELKLNFFQGYYM